MGLSGGANESGDHQPSKLSHLHSGRERRARWNSEMGFARIFFTGIVYPFVLRALQVSAATNL